MTKKEHRQKSENNKKSWTTKAIITKLFSTDIIYKNNKQVKYVLNIEKNQIIYSKKKI